MKSLLLLTLTLILAHSALVFAAPVPPMRWEYAFVDTDAYRLLKPGVAGSERQYGVELRLQRRAVAFLPYVKGSDFDQFLLDVFNRLGNQGWELATSPGYSGATKYIFKRRK